MKTMITVLSLMLALPAFSQTDNEATGDQSASGDTAAVEEFDREPVRCIRANRIDRTEVIDERTVLFYMRGGRREVYRNNLPRDCPRLAQEKRFSYDVRTGQLCNVDSITVLEFWGSRMRTGASCGLGPFFPITREEADLLDEDFTQSLEAAGAVEETVESSGEAVIPGEETDEN